VSATPETVESPVVSAAPELVRLSLRGGRTQVDLSLPLDLPIAGLIPHLAKLVQSGDADRRDGSDDPVTKEAKHTVWVVSRHDGNTALAPSLTLRQAGVTDGELLRLTAARTLSPPTLYDDVVDAAARLNKAGFRGWDATAARWMAFVGIYLVSGVWTYFLAADTFAGSRAVAVGLSVVVALGLVGVAASAHRTHGHDDVGAALGWAVLPIGAAVAWAVLGRVGGYQGAAGCAAMVIVTVATYKVIGTGHWGYLAAGLFFGLSSVGLVVDAAGVRADIVGAGMAVLATSVCLAVPRFTFRMARFDLPAVDVERHENTPADDPGAPPQAAEAKTVPAAESVAGEGVWDRVQSVMLTRSALYAGLAVTAATGVSTVLVSAHRPQWSDLVFSVACAATLGLYAARPATAVERAALAIPAMVLLVVSCARAQDGGQPVGLAGFGVLLLAIVVFAVIGTTVRAGRAPARLRALLAYSTYLGTAALLPLALWVIGVYSRLGIR
jgi:type VII secretion integral membrane protein EccD